MRSRTYMLETAGTGWPRCNRGGFALDRIGAATRVASKPVGSAAGPGQHGPGGSPVR